MATSPVTNSPAQSTATPPRDRHLWTLRDVESAATYIYPSPQSAAERTAADSVYAYVLGDHYQSGKAWRGAGYAEDGVTLSTSNAALLDRTLAPIPEAYSCIERRVDGACGNQAKIDLLANDPQGETDEETGVRQPSEQQKAAIAGWNSEFSAFWDRVGLWGGKDLRKPTGIRGMVAQASWHASGSACMRFYINPASRTQLVTVGEGDEARTELRIPRQTNRAEAFKHIELVTPPPDRCFVYTDPDTHQKTGVFLFTHTDGTRGAEVWFADGEDTVLRLLSDGVEATEPVRYPWGGLLPIVQADIGAIFTDPVRRLQGVLDVCATSLFNNIVQHGYSQRTESNAEETGYWSSVMPDLGAGVIARQQLNKVTKEVEYFHPTAPSLGPRQVVRLVGIEHTVKVDENQVETLGLTTPTVDYHDPPDTESAIKGVDAFTMAIRTACHQPHYKAGLLGSTAEASGEAYEQARAPFVSDIKGVGEAVDATVAPGATVATVMADWLTGAETPEFAEQYTVMVQSHPDAGTPSTQFQAETRANVAAELLSPEEGIARLGVQDVAGEVTKIAAARTLSVEKMRAEIAALWVGLGADFLTAAKRAGLNDKEAEELARSDGPPNIEQ